MTNFVESIIKSLLIIVDECNQQRAVRQEIEQASSYFQQYVKGQEEVKQILDKLLHLRDANQINEVTFKKVVITLFRFHKDNINFSNELIRIIELY